MASALQRAAPAAAAAAGENGRPSASSVDVTLLSSEAGVAAPPHAAAHAGRTARSASSSGPAPGSAPAPTSSNWRSLGVPSSWLASPSRPSDSCRVAAAAVKQGHVALDKPSPWERVTAHARRCSGIHLCPQKVPQHKSVSNPKYREHTHAMPGHSQHTKPRYAGLPRA